MKSAPAKMRPKSGQAKNAGSESLGVDELAALKAPRLSKLLKKSTFRVAVALIAAALVA